MMSREDDLERLLMRSQEVITAGEAAVMALLDDKAALRDEREAWRERYEVFRLWCENAHAIWSNPRSQWERRYPSSDLWDDLGEMLEHYPPVRAREGSGDQ